MAAAIVPDGQLLKKPRVKLVVDHPFFGTLVLHLPARAGETPLGTAHVDGRELVYNPAWVRTLDDDERMGLVAHEVMHVALGHCFGWRRGRRDAKRWMDAIDYVVNLIVTGAGLKIPKGGLLDQRFLNMSAERVFEMLPKNYVGGKAFDLVIELPIGPPGKGKGKSKDGKGKDGKGQGKDGEKPGDDHGHGTVTMEEAKAQEQKWKNLVVQAATVARSRGKYPAGIDWLMKEITQPKIHWTEVVARFVNETMRDDYDMMRCDRRYLGGLTVVGEGGVADRSKAVILPDLFSEGAEIAVAVDTSGSVPDSALRDFVSEVVALCRCRNVTRVRVMSCDAAVHMDEIIGPMDVVPKTFPGRGGTSFKPVFKRLEDGRMRPACLIYMTDLYGDFPSEPPPYPTLWVTYTRDVPVPFGEIIRYDLPKEDEE